MNETLRNHHCPLRLTLHVLKHIIQITQQQILRTLQLLDSKQGKSVRRLTCEVLQELSKVALAGMEVGAHCFAGRSSALLWSTCSPCALAWVCSLVSITHTQRIHKKKKKSARKADRRRVGVKTERRKTSNRLPAPASCFRSTAGSRCCVWDVDYTPWRECTSLTAGL